MGCCVGPASWSAAFVAVTLAIRAEAKNLRVCVAGERRRLGLRATSARSISRGRLGVDHRDLAVVDNGHRDKSLASMAGSCQYRHMPTDYYDEEVAARYDEGSAWMFDPAVLGPTVDLLAELAGDGSALEFAVGTGRVALPLAGRGVPVSGIELSTSMAKRLRAKVDGESPSASVRVRTGCIRAVPIPFPCQSGWVPSAARYQCGGPVG